MMKHFQVTQRGESYRLTHKPSGVAVQQYLCDFTTRGAALNCRNRIVACDPSFDWSDPRFAEAMTADLFARVWKATYASV